MQLERSSQLELAIARFGMLLLLADSRNTPTPRTCQKLRTTFYKDSAQMQATPGPSSTTNDSDMRTDSQPSYSTDSAAMQHSTFSLQGAKAPGSAPQEAISPFHADRAPPCNGADDAATHGLPANNAEGEASVTETQQVPSTSSNHNEQHDQAHATVAQGASASVAALPTEGANDAESAGQAALTEQNLTAADVPPPKAFKDMELIDQVAVPELVQIAEEAKIGWGRVKGYPSWPVSTLPYAFAALLITKRMKGAALHSLCCICCTNDVCG